MENENKALRDKMKEHQERVDKIPGAPKLLPKRDVGRFVEQPYSEDATPHPIPKTFKMPPYLRIYDGTTDPDDHLIHYVTTVKGNDLSKEQVSSVLLKKFGETLTGGALTWYSQLPARSISTFEEMADKFATAHAKAKKAEARINDIFALGQTTGEGLRDFLARFNKVRIGLPNISEGMAVAVFQNRLNRDGSNATKKLLSRLMKYPPTIWEEIHNAYCAEVRADEDDLNGPIQQQTLIQSEIRRDRRNDGRREQPPRFNKERHQPYLRTPNPPPPRHPDVVQRHVAPLQNERVYALEKLGTKVQWPQKMKSDPSARRSNVLCEFHQERGHKTEDSIGLRQEVVRMLNQGYLKELLSDKGKANFARGRDLSQGPPKPPSPARTIQMIIGGGDDSAINHVKFTTTHKLKRTIAYERYDDFEDSIIFDKSDTDGLSFPHYDALVITLRIVNTDVKRIMVDDGSSACIIHPRVLMQMKLEDKIIPCCITLTDFNNAVERTSGEISLPALVGGVTLETTFHVMNQETTYNAIIRRPWIHAMRAVPSSFYQVIKFPTPWGIFSIRGEPRTTQECYRIAQDCTHTKQLKGVSAEAEQFVMSGTQINPTAEAIKDPDVVEACKATVEDLDPVQLDDTDHSKKAYIGHNLPDPCKYHEFLTNHADLFSFSHSDMPGIPKDSTTNNLNVDPLYPPVRQMRRKFNAAINEAVSEEVEKLLANGSIRESKYPQWVANVVMVKKKNGKWRMCSFPLPHIDQLIDATAGHELLSFLDAYSGYNQIMMAEEDQEKTTFITHQGTYCYKVMPFGLKNAGATYQRLVTKMFKERLGKTMEVYIDDMFVKSAKKEDHIDHLKEGLGILR
ncbi:uncharacterized protein LOC142174352 [Nicotiana tabacum]|uniref:Uncharacterized protein LOC142174352 n=1 Tax=Nicotiana tabacum TaxID=4097 RepID=A0AC58TG96_TOBAC